ncbi:MAG: DUF4369 domain-containing protein [Bacteroidales bacterium]|nr:DUF4369 domain-containing protein [Bacteroidales bacterium]
MKSLFKIASSLLLVLTACCSITSCDDSDKIYVIDGVMHGGGNFEGETVYLVPFFNATNDRVDSAVIHNSRFEFRGKTDKPEVNIIRMRPMIKIFIEELILMREPGHIRTTMAETSVVKGTALNDSIQKWHTYNVETKQRIANLNKELRQARQRRNQPAVDSLVHISDMLLMEFNNKNRSMAQANKDNAFGQFLELYEKK